MAESIACNVAVLPDDELADKAIQASQKLSGLGTFFTLKKGQFYPHISIYMLQVNTDDIAYVEKLLATIAGQTPQLDLTADSYHQSHNYFDANYQKSAALSALQDKVINVLNPLRDGLRQQDKARLADATGLARQNFEKYGWNTVGELWRPHLTLTRFTNEQSDPGNSLAPAITFSGRAAKLALFESGENGTAARKVAEFMLGHS